MRTDAASVRRARTRAIGLIACRVLAPVSLNATRINFCFFLLVSATRTASRLGLCIRSRDIIVICRAIARGLHTASNIRSITSARDTLPLSKDIRSPKTTEATISRPDAATTQRPALLLGARYAAHKRSLRPAPAGGNQVGVRCSGARLGGLGNHFDSRLDFESPRRLLGVSHRSNQSIQRVYAALSLLM